MTFSEQEIAQALELLHQLDQRVARIGQQYPEVAQHRQGLSRLKNALAVARHSNNQRRAFDERQKQALMAEQLPIE